METAAYVLGIWMLIGLVLAFLVYLDRAIVRRLAKKDEFFGQIVSQGKTASDGHIALVVFIWPYVAIRMVYGFQMGWRRARETSEKP